MADRSSAAILIGGPLARASIGALVAAIVLEGIGPDYGDDFSSADDVRDYIEERARDGKPILLAANEVAGGEFPGLEKSLATLSLTWKRWDDGHYAYSATVSFWEPPMVTPRSWMCGSETDKPHLSIDELETHLAAGTLDDEIALMKRVDAFDIPFVIGD